MSLSLNARILPVVSLDVSSCQLDGFTKPYNTGNILCSCPAPTFLAAAVDEVVDFGTFPDIEGADTLGAVELVGREGEEIDVLGFHVHRDVPDYLHSISMERDFVLPCNRTQFRDRLDGTDLVVGVHDADQDRLVCDRPFEFRGVHKTVLVDREICDGESFLLQVLAGMKNRMVLDL